MTLITNVEIEPFEVSKCKWSRWIERLETAFEIMKAVSADKRTYLLHYMGQETYNMLCDRLSPEKPKDKTYDEIVAILKDHFEPEPLEIVENYRFHLRKQQEGEQVADYVIALRKLSINCKFGAYLDTALRNQLVFGMRHQKVQNRLLEVKDLTLKKAIEIATSMELSERGGAEIHQVKVEPVNLVNQRTKCRQRKSKEKSNSDRSSAVADNALKCYRCGGAQHLANNCRYKKATCNLCKAVGHLKRVCRKGATGAATAATNNITIEDLYNVSDQNSDKIFAEILVNNCLLSFEIDTGAPVTIISRQDAVKWFRHHVVQPADRRLSSYCGTEIKVHGYIVVYAQANGHGKQLKLYVVESTKPPLLGREWLNELHLDWKKIFVKRRSSEVNSVESNPTKPELVSLISKYAKIFEKSMGRIVGVKARLPIKRDAVPRFLKSRRIPFAIKCAVEQELDALVSQGILQKVDTSEWATPIVPVRKANNKVRICGDYKVTLNPQLVVEEHPLPTIDELFASMAGGNKFTKIDLSTAYLQMEVHEEDREALTLNTHKGLYRPTRLMYGVASAPAKFQREMENVLKDIDGVSVFIDDIKVTARDDGTHLDRLEEVFKRLSNLNMRVNLDKCEFLADSIEYCGYRIDRDGIHKMPTKVEAITNMAEPKSKEQVRTFCGMINYYGRFVENLSTKLYPLNNLLKDQVEFKWDKNCQRAFETTKADMKSDRVLVHFDPRLPVILATDASPYGVGATLSHRYPDGSERPIQFASQTLSDVQQRYSQIDKEALAVVFGVKKFHQFLFGRKFSLIVDNKPMMQIFSPQKGLPTLTATRMQHYAIFLEAYDFNIEYRKSADHANADALSRLPAPETMAFFKKGDNCEIEAIEDLPVTAEELANATAVDTEVSALILALKSGRNCEPQHRFGIDQVEFALENGCLMRGIRVYVPAPLRRRVLDELHASHFGMTRMKLLARSYCWWRGMDADIERLVHNCQLCQKNRANPPKISMHRWAAASKPFERVHVDYAGPFLGKYFFILVDAFSKWPEIHIVPNITTETTINVCRQIFSTFGTPEILVSDHGTQFTAHEFQQFLRMNGIEHRQGAPYHPATNGQAERYVRTFKDKLKTLKCKPSELNREICAFLLSYRRTVHPATGQSPAVAMFNRQIQSRLDLLFRQQTTNAIDHTVLQRTFVLGERVGARDYMGQDKWQFGIITAKLGTLHYNILLDDGRIWKRHVDQLIRIGDNILPANSPKPSITFNQPSQTHTHASPNHSSVKTPPTATTMERTASPIVTAARIASPRPQRNRQGPQRFTYPSLGVPKD